MCKIMSIQSPDDLAGLQAIGRIVALTLQAMARGVRPGITTAELDLIAARELARWGAESSPALVYGFPGASCISLNSQVVHGVPSPHTTVQAGDLVIVTTFCWLEEEAARRHVCRVVLVDEKNRALK